MKGFSEKKYRRADFTPLSDTGYGIGFHWTTWTQPRAGEPLGFAEAVRRFDVSAFVRQAVEAGAGHVLLTTTHEFHWMPCPNPEVDRILPGRTTERDLLMEIADGLASEGIRLMLYYNHGTRTIGKSYVQDIEWQRAVGSQEQDRARYYDNYCSIVSWLGEHYGSKVIAWWFDSGCEHARHDDTPWSRFSAAAKAGFQDRLIAYNAGVERFTMYTEDQDYWAGELNGLDFRPETQLAPNGLPWYSLVTWHGYDPEFKTGAAWGLNKDAIKREWPPPEPARVKNFVNAFTEKSGVVTFNLLCYQDGSIYDSDLATMRSLRASTARKH